MGLKLRKLEAELRRFPKIGLDSSVLVYHLEDLRPYSELTELVIHSVATGASTGILSTITLTELLVKPFAEKRLDRVTALETFVSTFPNLVCVPPGMGIAREGARLRTDYNLRTPDALIAATALAEGASALVTNDARLRRASAEGIEIVVLDDYL